MPEVASLCQNMSQILSLSHTPPVEQQVPLAPELRHVAQLENSLGG